MSVLRGEQARQVYARAQNQRELAHRRNPDGPARPGSAAMSTQREALSSARPEAPVRGRARAAAQAVVPGKR